MNDIPSRAEKCKTERSEAMWRIHIPLVIQNNNGKGLCVWKNWARRRTKCEVQRTTAVEWNGTAAMRGEGSMTTVKNMAMVRRILYQVFILILFMSLRIFRCTYLLFWWCECAFPFSLHLLRVKASERTFAKIEFPNYVFPSLLASRLLIPILFYSSTLILHSALHIVKLFQCFVVCLLHCKNEKRPPFRYHQQ